MNPAGSASRKKPRSVSVRVVPLKPKITASASRLDNETPHMPRFKRRATALGRIAIGDRPRLYAIENPLRAEIDAGRRETELAENIGLLRLESLPRLACPSFAAH